MRGRGRHGRTHGERERSVVGMDTGGEGVSTGVGVGAVFIGVVMHTVGVGMGGADATVYEVVAAAPEVSHGAPLQIRLRRQRPGA